MKRLIGATFVAALGATALIVIPSPASATGPDVCVGTGTATTADRVFYPPPAPVTPPPGVLADSATGTVTFAPTAGTCAAHAFGAAGSFTNTAGTLPDTSPTGNWCGNSTGTLTVASHHTASWTSAGTFLVVTGGATGTVSAVPDAANGQSCLSGATKFLASGALELS